jgi:hypothetical protein
MGTALRISAGYDTDQISWQIASRGCFRATAWQNDPMRFDATSDRGTRVPAPHEPMSSSILVAELGQRQSLLDSRVNGRENHNTG